MNRTITKKLRHQFMIIFAELHPSYKGMPPKGAFRKFKKTFLEVKRKPRDKKVVEVTT